MTHLDTLRYALGAVRGAPLRSSLMTLAMSIGVASVIVLTALGEAARNYVTEQFKALGSGLVIVLPGRSETGGAGVAMAGGNITRDLTIEDALALTRSPLIDRVTPLMVGAAPVSAGSLERDAPIFGATSDLLPTLKWELASGQFLPPGDSTRARPVCVIGQTLKQELFGNRSAVGQWLRIGERRFRVIGVLKKQGQSIGIKVADIAVIPVASARQLFNSSSLFRIMVNSRQPGNLNPVKKFIIDTLRERHQGEEDVTLVTQDAVLSTLDGILSALTLAVAGIGMISLAVAGILIMNVMLISVTQRTAEIGLLKALGAPPYHILLLFLTEAGLLGLFGALTGIILGLAVSQTISNLFDDLHAAAPFWALSAATALAIVVSTLFGVLPARRAARMDPIQALAKGKA